MKLYSLAFSPNCQKVLACARELGITLEVVPVDVFKGESRTPAYLAKNPNGKVPVLEDGDLVLWESNAILAYLAAQKTVPSLLPVKPRERAEVDRWLFWATAHLQPAVGKVAFEKIVKPLAGRGAPDAAVVAQGTADFATYATVLDAALEGREYVAGKLSIADFSIGPIIGIARRAGLDLSPYSRIRAWAERMAARESVKHTMGEVQAAAPMQAQA
jgi:glutathione S-transferase